MALQAKRNSRANILRGVAALGLAFAVTACATTPTPYQPYRSHEAGGIHGGYSEQILANGDYLVRFHGNFMTSRDRVEGYMLFRAADLTVEKGYDWFVVVDRNTEHNVHTFVEPNPLYRPWYGLSFDGWRPDWNIYVNGAWQGWYGGHRWEEQYDVRRIEAFETTAEIQMHQGPIIDSERGAIDARRVIAELGPTIERPRP